jgi:hypothetical protein
VDIRLKRFIPSLAEVPTREIEAIKERAAKDGFDFIDFWAVDFNWQEGMPFEHQWQDYRTRKDRSLRRRATPSTINIQARGSTGPVSGRRHLRLRYQHRGGGRV